MPNCLLLTPTSFFHLSCEAGKSLLFPSFFFSMDQGDLNSPVWPKAIAPARLVVRPTLILKHFRSLVRNPAVLSLCVECQADRRECWSHRALEHAQDLGKESVLCLHVYVGKKQPLLSNRKEPFLADKARCKAVTSH